MSAKLKELGEKRTSLYGQIAKLREEFNTAGKKWKDGEQAKTWEKVNKDYDTCIAEIESEQQAVNVDSRFAAIEELNKRPINPQNIGLDDAGEGRVGNKPAPGGQPLNRKQLEQARSLAVSGWFRSQAGLTPTKEQRNAARIVKLPLQSRELALVLPGTQPMNALRSQFLAHKAKRDGSQFEYNAALSGLTGSTGAYSIAPESMMAAIEVNMLAYGAVRQEAGQILTSSGEPFSWPTVDDTTNEGRIIGENTAADDNAGAGSTGDGGPNPSFGKTTWGSYKWTSDAVLVPYELMEDAVVPLDSIIAALLGERLGRGTNRKFTTGTGAGEPQGIVTGATLGVTAASATAITADEVIDLEHSVDVAYRTGAGYMLHDLTLAHIRKLKATTNQYIWQSNFNSGVPDTLNNRPYSVNNHMSNVGASSASLYTMLFGQLSMYKVRRVNQIRIYRLDERYRQKDQTGFVAFVREDGGILNPGTAPIKSMQQHS